jgi:transcriptional regulator with XRE-family HTH domain
MKGANDLKNERLVARRKQCGLTQEDLADRTGIAVRTISRLENGLDSPRASTVRLLCWALQATPHELGYDQFVW